MNSNCYDTVECWRITYNKDIQWWYTGDIKVVKWYKWYKSADENKQLS
jgi:hypothetical protein